MANARKTCVSSCRQACSKPLDCLNPGTTPPVSQTELSPAARWENQQDRIAQGIKDGQLTPSEAARLEGEESKLRQQAARLKAANGGKLSPSDLAKLEREQNHLSRQIKNFDNNSKTYTTPRGEVGNRLENQQDRIAQGIKSGQLTPGEAAKLEQKDARISQEVRNERAANGGKLTNAERAQVNRQENRSSKQIYKDKHNKTKAPR